MPNYPKYGTRARVYSMNGTVGYPSNSGKSVWFYPDQGVGLTVQDYMLKPETREKPVVTKGNMPPVRNCWYYVIEMPVDKLNQGPADYHNTDRMTYEVWDRELTTHYIFNDLPDAIDQVNEMNLGLSLVEFYDGMYCMPKEYAEICLANKL